MLVSYIITVGILSILLLICDYLINNKPISSGIIKCIIFIILSIGLILIMMYLRGDLTRSINHNNTSDSNNNNTNNNNNNNENGNNGLSMGSINRNLMRTIEASRSINGESGQSTSENNVNFFSNLLNN